MNIFNELKVKKEVGVLKNGVKVILFKKEGAPILTSSVLKSGSKYDPIDMGGISHFLEHMVVNGSKRFPTKDLLAEHIESIGGSYNAITNTETITVNTIVSTENEYSYVVDIYDAILCNPLMDKEVFKNEKNIIIKEINLANSDPKRLLTDVIKRLFFKNSPFEHNTLGNESEVKNFDYTNSLEIHKKLFDKSRMIFIASGDISIESLVNHLNKLELLSGENFVKNTDNIKISNEEKVSSLFFDVPQTHLFIGIPGVKPYSKEAYCLKMIGSILAGGRSSRFTKKLRYEKGLVYAVSNGSIGGFNTSTFGIFTNTTTDKVQEVIDLIIDEFKKINSEGFKKEELDFVKNRILKSYRIGMQTSSDWVDFHSNAEVLEIDFDVNKYIETISNITLEDLNETFTKNFSTNKLKLALCGRVKLEELKVNF